MSADIIWAKYGGRLKQVRHAQAGSRIFVVLYVVPVGEAGGVGVQEVEDINAGADKGGFAVGEAGRGEPGRMLW